MSDEELLESLDRHFAAGCLNLLPHQMDEHKATGTCRECRDRAKIASMIACGCTQIPELPCPHRLAERRA
jgi:hypothetical protein